MTLGECFSQATKALNNYSESPALDAKIFIKEICSLTDSDFYIHANKELSEDDIEEIFSCIKERQSGLPVAYILAHKDFYNLTFYTPQGVLIPRPETELLVDNAVQTIIKTFRKNTLSLLDLCAGTGCIGISTAKEVKEQKPQLSVNLSLSDLNLDAYNCFSINCENLLWQTDIEIQKYYGNLFEPMADIKFDYILTNPPYIETNIIPTLSKEVLSEPKMALDGGPDGLSLIKRIISDAPNHLFNGGFLFMEIGFNQAFTVKNLFDKYSFKNIKAVKDYSNNDRLIIGQI